MSIRLVMTAVLLAGVATGVLRAVGAPEPMPATAKVGSAEPILEAALLVPASGILFGHLSGSWSASLYCPPTHAISVQLRPNALNVGIDFRRWHELALVDGKAAWDSYRKILSNYATSTGHRRVDISASSSATASQLWRAISEAEKAGLEPSFTLPGWETVRYVHGNLVFPLRVFGPRNDAFSLREFGYGGVALLFVKRGLMVGDETGAFEFVADGPRFAPRLRSAIGKLGGDMPSRGLDFSYFVRAYAPRIAFAKRHFEVDDIAEDMGLELWGDAPFPEHLLEIAVLDGRL